MKTVSNPLKNAIGERLKTTFADNLVFVVNPSPTRTLPFGVLGNTMGTDAFSTKHCDGEVMTQTIIIWSHKESQAREFASTAIDALTDRDNPISIAAIGETIFYQSGRARLELNEIIQDRDERGDLYGAVFRLRYWIGQR